MRIGSLFSGIGGLELGLERAGLGPVIWQVEKDEWCRRVLARHWPNVSRYDDVKGVYGQFRSENVGDGGLAGCDAERGHCGPGVCESGLQSACGPLGSVDIICGGFPCQDISTAGNRSERKGLAGARSGLWFEMSRIISEVRPRWIIVENVPVRSQWVPFVRRDLIGLGYKLHEDTITAEECGAPHERARSFIVANTDPLGEFVGDFYVEAPWPRQACDPSWHGGGYAEPPVVRVADGVSTGLDRRRIAALGNAVVPQVAESIGRWIADIEKRRNAFLGAAE